MSSDNYDPMDSYGGMPPQQQEQSSGQIFPSQIVGFKKIVQRVYPIGSIYISTSSTNPGDSSVFGFGTWAAFGAGRVLVGVGTSDQAFAAGATGGESNHTLTTNEMPSHSHNIAVDTSGGYAVGTPNSSTKGATGPVAGTFSDRAGSYATSSFNQSTGGDVAHNNLQPYIVVYMWQRTA